MCPTYPCGENLQELLLQYNHQSFIAYRVELTKLFVDVQINLAYTLHKFGIYSGLQISVAQCRNKNST